MGCGVGHARVGREPGEDLLREAVRAAAEQRIGAERVDEVKHTQLAEVKFYYEWDWQSARRGYERALALNPNNSHALARYSLYLSALDEQDALRPAA